MRVAHCFFDANKYAKDADILLNEARKVALKENFNLYDKQEIKSLLEVKLKKELESKPFINEKKFELMNKEIETALKEMSLL